jgi:hypothetical protein
LQLSIKSFSTSLARLSRKQGKLSSL